MARLSDAQALKRLRETLKSRPTDSIDDVLKLGRKLPPAWRDGSIAELVV